MRLLGWCSVCSQSASARFFGSCCCAADRRGPRTSNSWCFVKSSTCCAAKCHARGAGPKNGSSSPCCSDCVPSANDSPCLSHRTRCAAGTAISSDASGIASTASSPATASPTRPAPRHPRRDREPDLGLPAHPRRTPQARHRGLRDEHPTHPRRGSSATSTTRNLDTVHASPSRCTSSSPATSSPSNPSGSAPCTSCSSSTSTPAACHRRRHRRPRQHHLVHPDRPRPHRHPRGPRHAHPVARS